MEICSARTRSRCVVMSYDYTVLAGTQGHQNHRKKDRMFQLARELRLPLVLFAEGGGGRPGDTDGGFHNSRSFHDFPKLSGLVPLVGITSGRCFAGNASLLGCCDVVIATRRSNIGMGGPAMIEGGGLRNLSARGNRADGGAGAQRRRRYRGRGRGRSRGGRAQISFILPGPSKRMDVRGPAYPAQYHSRESAARVRRARRDRDDGGYWVGARDSARLRADDDSRVHPDRGTSVWSSGEQPQASGGRDRQRRRRQGRAVYPVVRRVRHPDFIFVRHARNHGGAGRSRKRRWCGIRRGCF